MFLVTSPIIINVPTRGLLAVETPGGGGTSLETLSTRTGGGDGDRTSAYRLRRDRRRVSLA